MKYEGVFAALGDAGGSITSIGKNTQMNATPIKHIEAEYKLAVYFLCLRVENIGFASLVLKIIPIANPMVPPNANILQVPP